MMGARLVVFALSLLLLSTAAAQDSLYVRVIDVGQGHSAVVRLPGDHYMIFDAGHPAGEGSSAFDGIRRAQCLLRRDDRCTEETKLRVGGSGQELVVLDHD